MYTITAKTITAFLFFFFFSTSVLRSQRMATPHKTWISYCQSLIPSACILQMYCLSFRLFLTQECKEKWRKSKIVEIHKAFPEVYKLVPSISNEESQHQNELGLLQCSSKSGQFPRWLGQRTRHNHQTDVRFPYMGSRGISDYNGLEATETKWPSILAGTGNVQKIESFGMGNFLPKGCLLLEEKRALVFFSTY